MSDKTDVKDVRQKDMREIGSVAFAVLCVLAAMLTLAVAGSLITLIGGALDGTLAAAPQEWQQA